MDLQSCKYQNDSKFRDIHISVPKSEKNLSHVQPQEVSAKSKHTASSAVYCNPIPYRISTLNLPI
jgi:hypothetical protein